MERQSGPNIEIYYFCYFFSVLYKDQKILMEDNLNSYLVFKIKYIVPKIHSWSISGRKNHEISNMCHSISKKENKSRNSEIHPTNTSC